MIDMRYLLLLWAHLGIFFSLSAQLTIQGYLTDDESNPLPYANIWLHELNKGTTTDTSGYFSISIKQAGFYHLHISYVGYQTKTVELTLKKDTTLFITLNKTELEMHEVVIETPLNQQNLAETSQDLEAVYHSTLLDRNYANLMQNLDRIPGVTSINIGVGTSKPVLRGLSMNRVLVAENGIKQEGQQWGIDHGLELDPFHADVIEIVKGPSALLFGSDAIAGVIHIKHTPPLNDGLQFHSFQGFRSMNNAFFNSLATSFRKKNFAFQARATYQNFADYKVPADSFTYNTYVLPIQKQTLTNTAGREFNQQLRLYFSTQNATFNLAVTHFYQKLGFFPGAFGIPNSYNTQQDFFFRNIKLPLQNIHHLKVQSNNKWLIGKQWLEMDAAFQKNLRKEFSNAHQHGQNKTDTLALGLDLQTFTFNTRWNFQNPLIHAITGLNAQFQKNSIQGFEFLIPNYLRKQFGFFQFVQYRFSEKLIANSGLRIDYGNDAFQEAYVDFFRRGSYIGKQLRSPSFDRNYWNYSLALGISWLLSQTYNLKLNLANAFRFPAPNELASNGIHHGTFRHELGSTNLNPEKAYQADLTFLCNKPHLQWKVATFFAFFQDFIYLSPTAKFSPLPEGGQIYQYLQNYALLMGYEASVDWHAIKNLHLNLATDFVLGQNLDLSRPLPFMPQPSALCHAEYTLQPSTNSPYKFPLWLEYRYTFAQSRVVINEPETPAFHLLHLGAQANATFKKHELTLAFQIQNAMNARYFYHLSKYRYLNIYEPARNFIISLLYKF